MGGRRGFSNNNVLAGETLILYDMVVRKCCVYICTHDGTHAYDNTDGVH